MKKITAPASEIRGMGHYVPSQCIDNAQIESWLNLEPGWVERRTGIKTRHWANENESLVDLALHASQAALRQANIPLSEIGLAILATSTPDRLLPPSAPLLAHRLGLTNAGAFDLAGACSGFLYALTVADGFARTQNKPVLIVAANILSRRINLNEQNSAVLFADAAGAMVIAPSPDMSKGILGVTLLSDGSHYDLLTIEAGGSEKPFHPETPSSSYKMTMRDGQTVFSKAVDLMVNCAQQALAEAQLQPCDIQHFLPHQGNVRITDCVSKKLGIPLGKTIPTLISYGNPSAASIPLSLSMTQQAHPYLAGEKLLLTAAGAGMMGGAMVIGM